MPCCYWTILCRWLSRINLTRYLGKTNDNWFYNSFIILDQSSKLEQNWKATRVTRRFRQKVASDLIKVAPFVAPFLVEFLKFPKVALFVAYT